MLRLATAALPPRLSLSLRRRSYSTAKYPQAGGDADNPMSLAERLLPPRMRPAPPDPLDVTAEQLFSQGEADPVDMAFVNVRCAQHNEGDGCINSSLFVLPETPSIGRSIRAIPTASKWPSNWRRRSSVRPLLSSSYSRFCICLRLSQ